MAEIMTVEFLLCCNSKTKTKNEEEEEAMTSPAYMCNYGEGDRNLRVSSHTSLHKPNHINIEFESICQKCQANFSDDWSKSQTIYIFIMKLNHIDRSFDAREHLTKSITI